MKRSWIGVMAAAAMGIFLTACGGAAPAAATTAAQTTAAETTAAQTTATETTAAQTTTAQTTAAQTTAAAEKKAAPEGAVRVGSLKGPTTMGLVNLMKAAETGEAEGTYDFTMATQADELLAKVVSGDLDIALIPANAASVLYNKTKGGISVIDVNTLGVLYCVTGDDSIQSVADLAGKKVITTGQGTTPEYVMNILLAKNEVKDCTLEFKSEATEVAAALKADPKQIAVLPQPFVTVAEAQNDALKTAFSLTEEWDKVSDGSRLLTGVTVARKAFLDENKEKADLFLKEHAASAEKAVSDPEGTAALVAEYGIIEKAPVAKKALPFCNIVCITGEEMKTALSGYLKELFGQDPKSVGGALPEDGFYYIGK